MYDLIIIGAGPAGLTAAIYAARACLRTMILEKLVVGGRVLLTETIENFPGFPGGIPTQKLMRNMEEQVRTLGVELVSQEVIDLDCKARRAITANNEYAARAVIIATGTHERRLGVPGENEFIGRGVSYCATCDGPLYRDKKVIVVGAGNTAAEEALYLTRFAASVTLIHRRDALRATKILQDSLRANKKIRFVLDTLVSEIIGQEKVCAVRTKNVKTQKEEILDCDGVFIYVGIEPNTAFLTGKIKLDEQGFIVAREDAATSVEGIFACGDCCKKSLYQVITACSDGAIAAESVAKYLL